jgi:hypothetical protein
MQASRDNTSVSRVVENSRLNGLQKALISIEGSFVNNQMVLPKRLYQNSQTHMSVENDVNGLGFYYSKCHRYKIRGKCHYEQRHDPIIDKKRDTILEGGIIMKRKNSRVSTRSA